MTRPGLPADDDVRSARLREIERGVESRLQELADAGELSGLPGEGRPLPKDEDAGDRWAALHVTRNAGVLPEWSDLRREIDTRLADVVARARRHRSWLRSRERHLAGLPAERILDAARITRTTDARVRAELAAAVAELDQLVQRYDLIVPVAALQIAPLTLERVFALAERDA